MRSFYSEFSRYYEAVFPFQESAFSFLQQYADASGTQVLDAGCGTGQYASEFARGGAEVLGIDRDAHMITYAKAHYQIASFLEMDMSQIQDLGKTFDLIYSIGNVISHLSESGVRHFLEHVYKLLCHGGYWIFQVVNWDAILSEPSYNFPDKIIEGGSLKFIRQYGNVSDREVSFRTALMSGEEVVFDEVTPLYPLKHATYLSLHRDIGFTLCGNFGDYTGTPFDPAVSKANIMVFQT
ncbi:MAG: class I SAM-dependent methyltransferase [Candidatus Latescibacteria bacterium]|jgi:2-polyprenyl-3-methyl-5-hydroxy-6-metoxy-1,4-benzoquinol methylase|nr:class I SAM-dependent methyltransferase [Candidatus Latescibacterota bacterium]